MNPTGNSSNSNPTSSIVSTTNDQVSNGNNGQVPTGVANISSFIAHGIPNPYAQMLVQQYMAQRQIVPSPNSVPLTIANANVPSGGNGQIPTPVANIPFFQNIQGYVPQNLNQSLNGQGLSTVNAGAIAGAASHVASTSHGNTDGHSHVRDSSWLKLQVCPLYRAGNRCQKPRDECDFAHPESNVKIDGDMVTVCFDHMKRGECQHPNCKYFHVSPRQKAIVERQGGFSRTPNTNTMVNEIAPPNNGVGISAMQLAGYLPFSGSTTTAAISGANVPLNLTPLFQQMVAPNAAASLALYSPILDQIPPATNMAFQVPCQNASALSANSFELGNRFQFNGQILPTQAMPATPNAVFDSITQQELVNRFPPNWNLHQLQTLLTMIQNSTPQTYPMPFVPVQTSASNVAQVTAGCKRPNGNNMEEPSMPHAKRSYLPSDNAATSHPISSSTMKGNPTIRAPELQFPSQNTPKNLFVPGISNPTVTAANVVSCSPLSVNPPNLPDLNNNSAFITHCAFFNEDGRPVESVQVCRDFLAGRCSRGVNCNYVHIDNPRDLEIVNNRVPLCRDAIGGRCTRNRCRFYHIPEEILENRQRQCIINTVQSSCLSDNCSLDNASDADVIAIPTSTSNDGDGAPASANDPAKASSAFKAEGDSGNNKSPVVQSHSTQSPNIQSSKSEPSERS